MLDKDAVGLRCSAFPITGHGAFVYQLGVVHFLDMAPVIRKIAERVITLALSLQALDIIVAFMKPNNVALAISASIACRTIVADSVDNHAHLGKNGGIKTLVEQLEAADEGLHEAAAQLMVQVTMRG